MPNYPPSSAGSVAWAQYQNLQDAMLREADNLEAIVIRDRVPAMQVKASIKRLRSAAWLEESEL